MHPVHEVVVVVECRMPADSARHKSPIVLLLQPTFLAAAVCCRCCALLGACNFVFSSVRPGRCRVWSRRGSCAAVHSPSLSRAQSVCLSVCLSGCRSPVILSGDECARHLPRDRLPTALPLAPSSSSLIFRGNRTRTQPLLNRPLSSSLSLLSLSLSFPLPSKFFVRSVSRLPLCGNITSSVHFVCSCRTERTGRRQENNFANYKFSSHFGTLSFTHLSLQPNSPLLSCFPIDYSSCTMPYNVLSAIIFAR